MRSMFLRREKEDFMFENVFLDGEIMRMKSNLCLFGRPYLFADDTDIFYSHKTSKQTSEMRGLIL